MRDQRDRRLGTHFFDRRVHHGHFILEDLAVLAFWRIAPIDENAIGQLAAALLVQVQATADDDLHEVDVLRPRNVDESVILKDEGNILT